MRKVRFWTITNSFIGFILVITSVFAIQEFYQKNPLSKQWTYRGRFSVLDSDSFTVTSYPSDNISIIQVILPEDVFVYVPDGYGYYRLGDVPKLSRSERRGDELMVKSISNLLGVPIESTKRQLSYWDQYKIWRISKDTAVKKQVINLAYYPVTTSEARTDGSTFERFDGSKIQLQFEDVFWERAIREEGYTVGVYNASGAPGVAQTVSRMLETVGFRVVEIANWDEQVSDTICQIRIQDNDQVRKSVSIERLVKITGCKLSVIPVENKRFDMQVIVFATF